MGATMVKSERTKRQTIVDEILHVKLKITPPGPLKIGVNSEAQQGKTGPSSIVVPVVTHVKNPVISHKWGNDDIVTMTNGTYPGSFATHIP